MNDYFLLNLNHANNRRPFQLLDTFFIGESATLQFILFPLLPVRIAKGKKVPYEYTSLIQNP